MSDRFRQAPGPSRWGELRRARTSSSVPSRWSQTPEFSADTLRLRIAVTGYLGSILEVLLVASWGALHVDLMGDLFVTRM